MPPASADAAAAAPRVGLVMLVVGDLAGSGGAERQFTDLFEYFRGRGRVSLITTAASVRRLREAGRLDSADGVIALPLGDRPARGLTGVAWLTLSLLWATWGRRFDVIHLCLPTPSYVPYAALLTRLPRALRPRIVITVIDCTLAHNLTLGEPADLYEQQVVDAHRLYFTWTRLDGVFTWYREFASAARTHRWFPPSTLVTAAKFCFADVRRFQPAPARQNVVVFAGRLSAQKRPLLFVDAVACLRENDPALAARWRFEMYGGGPLEEEVRRHIDQRGLSGVIALTRVPDLSPVFAASQLFVSTQKYENFTSLAMLEAMAAGNAVIAENVGQTAEFVQHGENGLLVADDRPESFAGAIAEYLRAPELHAAMAAKARAIATGVHTIENFAADIEAFWQQC